MKSLPLRKETVVLRVICQPIKNRPRMSAVSSAFFFSGSASIFYTLFFVACQKEQRS